MKQIKSGVLLAGLLLLMSCSSLQQADSWPADLPDSRIFVQAWNADTTNQAFQEQAEYLVWVQRFFYGYNIAPGWQALTRQVLGRLPAERQQVVGDRLAALGLRIGQEWAKNNQARKINTRMAATWRDALQEALSQNDLDHYMDRLDADVTALLAGELDGSEIAFERYYVDEFDI